MINNIGEGFVQGIGMGAGHHLFELISKLLESLIAKVKQIATYIFGGNNV